MAKKIFELVIDTKDLDPDLRCYYDCVDDSVPKEEVDAALAEIYEQMAEPVRNFDTVFHAWFYNKLGLMYDTMADTLWDAIDTYVQDELEARFKED